MVFTPLLKFYTFEPFGNLLDHQYFGACRNLELRLNNCLEAYGIYQGTIKCADLMSDFRECVLQSKQKYRTEEMRKERKRQKVYADPPRGDCYSPTNGIS